MSSNQGAPDFRKLIGLEDFRQPENLKTWLEIHWHPPFFPKFIWRFPKKGRIPILHHSFQSSNGPIFFCWLGGSHHEGSNLAPEAAHRSRWVENSAGWWWRSRSQPGKLGSLGVFENNDGVPVAKKTWEYHGMMETMSDIFQTHISLFSCRWW